MASPRCHRHTTPHQFLGALLRRATPSHFVEIRAIGGTLERPRQWFVRVGDAPAYGLPPAVVALDGQANIYYSVTPRLRPGGHAADCGPALGCWADFDSGAPAALPLAPSLVVESSPGKYQTIWLLDQPQHNAPLICAINRGIAGSHGADLGACDIARVLRLPGFKNVKYAEAPTAELRVCRPETRYTIGRLQDAFPPQLPTETKKPYSGQAPGWLDLVFEALWDFLEAGGYRPKATRDGGAMSWCPLCQVSVEPARSMKIHPSKGWKSFCGCGQGRLTALAYKLGVRVREGGKL